MQRPRAEGVRMERASRLGQRVYGSEMFDANCGVGFVLKYFDVIYRYLAVFWLAV